MEGDDASFAICCSRSRFIIFAVRGCPVSELDASRLADVQGRSERRVYFRRPPTDAVHLYSESRAGTAEYYDGAINTVGIDIGVSAGSVLAWGVFAPTTGLPQGALSGEYVGASGDVGFVVGGGANVLVGGSGRTVALQPLSLQGSLAFNVVLGVSSLKLRPATWR
jgi:hypothetical protein